MFVCLFVIDILHRTKNEILISNPTIRGLIPQSLKVFQKAINNGTARSLLQDRSLEWLQEHGEIFFQKCM